MQWQPEPRDKLIDKVRRGLLTPDEAELEAQKQGCGPLATMPNPIEFDANEIPWWSFPMAVAWIAWRNSASVQEHCAKYRDKWLIWASGSWNVPAEDGNGFERINGYELKTVGPSTVCRLSLTETWLKCEGKLREPAKMSVSEAEKQLLTALAAGRIVAVAKNAAGGIVEIPQREWPYLELFDDGQRDVLKHDVLDRQPAFSDIKLERDKLKQLWEEHLIERYMIEPMMRAGTAGYVPFCSAVHWIMTEAGQKTPRLEDAPLWRASLGRLLPLMSTGEVKVIGTPSSSGGAKPIEGHIFAGVLVSEVLRTSLEIMIGDKPWINCTPYVDEEYWNNDFNDQLYLQKSGPASWTHLQVRKSDILREFSFEQRQLRPYETGAPGRPTSMHLIKAEFLARHERGESMASITLEADALAKWLEHAHSSAVPVKPKTIRNQLAEEFRKRLATPKKKK